MIGTYSTVSSDIKVKQGIFEVLVQKVYLRFKAITDGFNYEVTGRVLAPVQGLGTSMTYYRNYITHYTPAFFYIISKT